MSGYDANPFADPNSDPFSDQVVREARGGGVQPDNLHDFNPFDKDQTATKVQQPAILPTSSAQPPSYSTSSAAAYDAGTEDIRRRQEELERKAAELERRERAMQQTAQGQHLINNFPPLPSFCPVKPCFYQDFVLDIPAEFQRTVKAGFYIWIAYSVVLFLNVLGSMAYFFGNIQSGESTQSSGITFGLSIFYFCIFVPCSFVCWYRPLYKAFRSDSSFNFFVFFFIFFAQCCVCIIQSFGIQNSGTVGWISAMSMINAKHSNNAPAAIMFIVGSLFALMAAADFLLLFRVHRLYRTTGASFMKAQEEFAHGVVSNRTVQQTATGVAASAARGAVDQYGSSGNSRY